MPLVMAKAMTSAATPAATPATEIAVTTPTTACRRLALRYRAARKNSNRIEPGFSGVAFPGLLFLGGNHSPGYAQVVVPIVGAHSDDGFADFARSYVQCDAKRIVFGSGVGDLSPRLDVHPWSCVQRVLGVSDGRECILCVERHLELLGAMSAITIGGFGCCLEVENYRRRCVNLETIAYLLAGKRVGGSVGGSVGSHDFDLVSTVGNQGCVKAVGLVCDLVLEQAPHGFAIATQIEGVDEVVAIFVMGCPAHGDCCSVLGGNERRCSVGAGDFYACGWRGKCNVDGL